jgi:hypothetical protein
VDNIPNDKDDFVEGILNGVIAALGYDRIGLDANLPAATGLINATLLQGDYFVGHNIGWTDFNVDADTGDLLVNDLWHPALHRSGAGGRFRDDPRPNAHGRQSVRTDTNLRFDPWHRS